jgi:hypothetical protein
MKIKKVLPWLIIPTSLLLTKGVLAQTAPADHSATVEWNAVTTYTDGTAISGTVYYNVYLGVGKGNESNVAMSNTTSLSAQSAPIYTDGTTVCAYVTATVNGVTSNNSAEGCGVVPAGTPNAPVIIKVQIN